MNLSLYMHKNVMLIKKNVSSFGKTTGEGRSLVFF